MSLAQLKDQAVQLDLGEQRELIAFLISRQTEQDEDVQDAKAMRGFLRGMDTTIERDTNTP